jgi:hypothetical protein
MLLMLAAACGGDYSRSTSPSDYPKTPGDTTTYPPPDGNPYPSGNPGAIVSVALQATDTVLVAGSSTRLTVVGLDSLGRTVATLPSASITTTNGFSFLVEPDGRLTALYSSFTPTSGNVTASVVRGRDTLTATRHFSVTSAAPRVVDFAATMLPENVRPEPQFSVADGVVYLTLTDSGVDFTLLWAHILGRPIGAHLHGPAFDFDTVTSVLADFPVGDEFADHGILRGTLTQSSIRAVGGNPPIALDSLVTLLKSGLLFYADVHSAAFPAGEVRGALFRTQGSSTRVPVALRERPAAAAPRA